MAVAWHGTACTVGARLLDQQGLRATLQGISQLLCIPLHSVPLPCTCCRRYQTSSLPPLCLPLLRPSCAGMWRMWWWATPPALSPSMSWPARLAPSQQAPLRASRRPRSLLAMLDSKGQANRPPGWQGRQPSWRLGPGRAPRLVHRAALLWWHPASSEVSTSPTWRQHHAASHL